MSSNWEAVKEAFDSAVDMDAESRSHFLSELPPEVLAEVKRLLQADADAGDFLTHPALFPAPPAETPAVFQPGDLLGGRFQILRLLGTGGMGQVFEALDTELHQHVALKAVRPDFASSDVVLARFRKEVRLARAITHPNVCRTYDLSRVARADSGHETQQIVFLTMEYLPGITLRTRLADERLSIEECLRLATQVAEGLAAAHALGIVHRDIKPGNVMLVGDRAVITDFGLARFSALLPDAHASHLTTSGAVAGTPHYMAPEQLRGGKITPAADLYAFATMTVEMLTGSQDHALAALPRQVPHAWRAALERCLQPDPAHRFDSAAEMLLAVRQFRRRRLQKRLPWLAASVAAAAALTCGVLQLAKLIHPPPVAAGSRVVLAHIRNQTGDPRLDNAGELLRSQLTQAARITLATPDQVAATLEQMRQSPDTPVEGPVAREVAMREGAVRLVEGAVTKNGAQYSLELDVEQPDNTPAQARHTWPKTFTWPAEASGNPQDIPKGLLQAVRDGGDWVRSAVGESANDIARLSAPPQDVTTSNWAALEAYHEGVQNRVQGKLPEAIHAFRRAVALDPQFANAWLVLGETLGNYGQEKEADDAFKTALQTDASHRLTRRERDQLKIAETFYTDDEAAELAAYDDLTEFYEHDTQSWWRKGDLLARQGRFEEAAACAEKAFSIDPGDKFVLLYGLYFQIEQESAAGVQLWLSRAKQHATPEWQTLMQAVAAFWSGDSAQATRGFASIRDHSASSNLKTVAYEMLADIAAEKGDTAAALATLDDYKKYSLGAGDASNLASAQLNTAELYCQNRQWPECLRELSKLDMAALAGFQRMRAARLASVATLRAEPSLRPAFRKILQDSAAANDKDPYGTYYAAQMQGEIAISQAKFADAVAAMQRRAGNADKISDRDYLGRALLNASEARTDPATAKHLRDQAAEAFAFTANHPGRVLARANASQIGVVAGQKACYVAATAGNTSKDSPRCYH